MTQAQKTHKAKRKEKKEEDEKSPAAQTVSGETKEKLKELDNFIEGVLEEAGEEFLDEFRQIEGE